ncbi:hypothetical protein AQI70_14040 [Streptomyces curacoi]|uniref:Uncharacterized protein n=1 Tax=Streptomyces curacoi TaxID=146536 RepID=A0A117PCM0_9ACTN|nr:hypothetical protein AQI70_14040 [Streptomyces curacoi]
MRDAERIVLGVTGQLRAVHGGDGVGGDGEHLTDRCVHGGGQESLLALRGLAGGAGEDCLLQGGGAGLLQQHRLGRGVLMASGADEPAKAVVQLVCFCAVQSCEPERDVVDRRAR